MKLWFTVIAVLSFILDRLVKSKIQHAMTPGESITVIPDVFHITFVYNTGAAFSLFKDHPEWLLGVNLILFLGLLLIVYKFTILDKAETLAFGLIIGGALGNIYDRIAEGRVVDYLDFIFINYPVFNLADTFIFCGITLLVYRYLRYQRLPFA